MRHWDGTSVKIFDQRKYSQYSITIRAGALMEQHIFKNVNNCLNTNIYSYLETSGGQSYNPYLNVVHFFNNSHY